MADDNHNIIVIGIVLLFLRRDETGYTDAFGIPDHIWAIMDYNRSDILV